MDKEVEKLACEACSEEAQRADEEQINAFISSHPEWEIKIEPDATFLSRTFKFTNFVQAAAVSYTHLTLPTICSV